MTCQDCAHLLEENHRLATALTETQSILEQAQSRITTLEKANADLEHRLKAYENPHTPPSRRRVIYPKQQRLADAKRYPGRPRGHVGVTRPRPRPTEVVEPPRREKCRCGAALGEPDSVSGRVVEEIGSPSPRRVIEYLSYTWTCPVCGGQVSSTHHDCPPSGRFGKNTHVQTTLMKYRDRLTLRRTAEALNRTYGVKISPATVLELNRRVATWLRPEIDAMIERIRGSPVLFIDETGLKVDGARYWVWVFTAERDTLTVIRRSRGRRVLKDVLGKRYKGVVVCDGWKSYMCYADRIQRCWAHILREARYLAEVADEAKPLYAGLKGLYEWLLALHMDKPPPLVASRLVYEGREEVLRLTRGPWVRKDVAAFARKVRNGLDHWFTFLVVPGVEPSNNRAERMLREVVVQRKIVGCLRNEKGTMILETVMSLLLTWGQRGLDLGQALGDALTKEWTKS